MGLLDRIIRFFRKLRRTADIVLVIYNDAEELYNIVNLLYLELKDNPRVLRARDLVNEMYQKLKELKELWLGR